MRSAAVSKVGIYGGGADRDADLAHGFAHRIEEGVAGVLHQMPTVGDLGGLRQRLGRSKGVTAAAVARDDSDLRLPREPGLRSGRLSVGQQGDRSSPLEVADDCSVALIAPPCPVVDTDHARRSKGRTPAPSNHPKQRIVAHGQHKSTGKTRRRAATQGKPKVMDDQIEPGRSPRPRRQSAVIEALGENTSTAHNSIAAEAARHDHQANRPPRHAADR